MTDSSVTSLHTRLALEPSRPRLTWYGDAGERVELTGPGLAQWVTKAANLLVEELDAGPGFRVLLDLPGHWRAVVWALATWRVGACVVVGEGACDEGPSAAEPVVAHDDGSGVAPSFVAAHDEPTDAVVTSSPSFFDGRRGVVAVALPALARSFPAPLPAGALDGSAVLGYGDVLGYAPPVDLSAPALVGPGGAVTYADLVRGGGATGRTLVDGADTSLDSLLREVLETLVAEGSVVLVGGAFAAELKADHERRTRLMVTERVNA